MTTARSFLTVPFTGTRSGVFPLAWGQHWIWNSVAARAPHFSDFSGSYVVEVPDGCDLPAVADGLAAVVDRYETFRSRYAVGPDGVPQQVVFADGNLRVEVRDVDAVDVAEAAAAVEAEFNNLPFTLPELPLRATVIVADDVPRFVVLCAFHLAMDCHGMVSVLDHLLSVLCGRSVDPLPGDLTHPVDRALEERGADGVRRSARGVRYWAEEVAKFPEDPLPRTGRRPESPRYKTFAMHSALVGAASLDLAEELGVTSSSVILAVVASLLAGRSGRQTCGIVLAANHRYDPESTRYAGTLAQGVPVALRVSDIPLRELISRCHRTGMLAALAGHCHPGDLAEVLHRSYGAEAAEARLACVVNLDVPQVPASAARDVPRATRTEAEHLLAESRYEYAGGTPVENERFYLAAHGGAADFSISLRADTAVLTSAEIVEFLRELERSLLGCLSDPRHTGHVDHEATS